MFPSLKTSMPATLDVFKVVVFICLFHNKLRWYLSNGPAKKQAEKQ